MTNKNGNQKSPSWDDIREATFNSGETGQGGHQERFVSGGWFWLSLLNIAQSEAMTSGGRAAICF